MPAVRCGGLATVKIVTAVRRETPGLNSHVMAYGPEGELIAIIEAHQLTARRTAAASVLAAKALGAGHSRHLAVLGAGRQARAQVEAYADAMPLETVTVWARRPERAEEFARSITAIKCRIQVAVEPEGAVRHAQIVTCATPSQSPLVLGTYLAPGTHVDLVGGFRPTMREADDAAAARAAIVADTPAALLEAGDLVQPIASGVIESSDVVLLASLLAGQLRQIGGDITMFKSVGHAAEDLVVTELLLERLNLLPSKSQGSADHA